MNAENDNGMLPGARSGLLAAASAAQAAALDLIEQARNHRLKSAELDEIVSNLVDAIMLVEGARLTENLGKEAFCTDTGVLKAVEKALESE
jgi:hypothetical protein